MCFYAFCQTGWYLFNWDKIPGNDSDKLIEFLKQKFSIDWAKTAKIEKIDDGRTIRVSLDKNYLSLRLNNEKTNVILEIDDNRTDELLVEKKNGNLNVYTSRICIKFVNERIFINGRKGNSRILMDCLVENQGVEPINDIIAIYPNVLSDLPEYDESSDLPSSNELNTQKDVFEACEDLPESIHTHVYKMEGRTFIIEGRSATLTEPNPDDPTQNLTFKGKICPVRIQKVPRFGEIHYEALRNLGGLGFTPFYITFPDPLQSKETRWLRFVFRPKKTATIIEEEIPFWFLRDLSKKSSFDIFGPSQVKNRFNEHWISFKQVHEGKILLIADDIERLILQPALDSKTPIEYYRINVSCQDSTFYDVESTGSIKEREFSPKKDDESNLLWYDFISRKPTNPFSINIKINYQNLFYRLMPFLSFILALAALILALYVI